MDKLVTIVGGGIGGLAAALACGRHGGRVQLLEQAAAFAEVGAGVQLGPNAVRCLHAWGLEESLEAVAAFPDQLEVRNAVDGDLLGVLPLGPAMQQRYGAPYITIARPDLHALLLQAVQAQGQTELMLQRRVTHVAQNAHMVSVQSESPAARRPLLLETDVLVAADGLWSHVRSAVIEHDEPPRASGHVAYRAMVAQSHLPQGLRSQTVTVWLGADFHVVQYPVRRGEYLNVVAVVAAPFTGDIQTWDHSANAMELRALLANAGGPLLDLIHAIDAWRLWPLSDRPPVAGAAAHALGRIALLGDAAHPMRPYLAQGAGMAIEDAAQLALSLAQPNVRVRQAVRHYAEQRWARNARVQAKAVRNGEIFHATGLRRVGRDVALSLLGKRLLDQPWLYGGGPKIAASIE